MTDIIRLAGCRAGLLEIVSLFRGIGHTMRLPVGPRLLLSLDQEKAFDRVDSSLLRFALSHMGFGPSFVSWTDLFYAWV